MSDSVALTSMVEEFARDITATVQAVLGNREVDLRATVLDDLVVVSTEDSGVVLTCGTEPVLVLRVSYRCGWDSHNRFIAVARSEFHVLVIGQTEPILRIEFDRDAPDTLPTAHLHVHGHRDATTWAMSRAGTRTKRSRQRRSGGVPSMKELHLPLGGRRFRPALEDVMQLLVEEFGIDAADGWRAHIAEGRARWRRMQTRAAVRDSPEDAAEVLRDLGYDVVLRGSAPAESGALSQY